MRRSESVPWVTLGLALTATLAVPSSGRVSAQQVPTDVVVHFGPVHPQPAAPANHVLVPNEVTILKGGTVTFQVNGGGHGVAIYPVSTHTTRADIEEDLCANGPGGPCVGGTANPHHTITDGKGDVVVEIEAISPGGSPVFDYAPERLLGAVGGTAIFLNGSTNPAIAPPPPPAPGVRLVHRFVKTGRYLVICMNRFHSINDYMFGFVNVVGEGEDEG